MINFYHCFLLRIADTLHPLYDLLSSGVNKLLVWSAEATMAFEACKNLLADFVLLVFPVANVPTALTTDASDTAVGAVLEQFIDNSWQPLAFFSWKFRSPELKNSIFDHELLAMFLAVRHFRYFLEGRQFTLFTDHKPLTFVFACVSDLGWLGNNGSSCTCLNFYRYSACCWQAQCGCQRPFSACHCNSF